MDTTTNEYEMEEFFSQRTPGKYDIETMKEAEEREHDDEEFDPDNYVVDGYINEHNLTSSDIEWLKPKAEEGDWDAMHDIIVGAETFKFKSWQEACDIDALKERLISDCKKMDNADLMSICDDVLLVMNKKCFYERARKLKEARLVRDYAACCAQGWTKMGIKQNVSFALRLYKEAADLGDEQAKEVLERAEYEDDWYLNV